MIGRFKNRDRFFSLATVQVTLPVLIFLSVTVSTVVGVGGIFYANHIRLKKAIVYSELERTVNYVAFGYQRELAVSQGNGELNSVFAWTEKGLTHSTGSVWKIDNWTKIEAGFKNSEPRLLMVDGQGYVARSKHLNDTADWRHAKAFSAVLTITPVAVNKFINLAKMEQASIAMYVVSSSGQLIATNHGSLNEKVVLRRPIVQKFITSQLPQGAHDFTNERGQPGSGYYFEIPGSDMTLFAETQRSFFAADFWSYLSSSIWLLLGMATILTVALMFAFKSLFGHLSEIVAIMEKLAYIPHESSLSETNIREIRFLKDSFKRLESRVRYLYEQRRDSNHREEEPLAEPNHEIVEADDESKDSVASAS